MYFVAYLLYVLTIFTQVFNKFINYTPIICWHACLSLTFPMLQVQVPIFHNSKNISQILKNSEAFFLILQFFKSQTCSLIFQPTAERERQLTLLQQTCSKHTVGQPFLSLSQRGFNHLETNTLNKHRPGHKATGILQSNRLLKDAGGQPVDILGQRAKKPVQSRFYSICSSIKVQCF